MDSEMRLYKGLPGSRLSWGLFVENQGNGQEHGDQYVMRDYFIRLLQASIPPWPTQKKVRLWEIGFRLYRMVGVQKHKDRQSLPLIAKRSERTQPEEWAGLRV